MKGFKIPIVVTSRFTEENSNRRLKESIDNFIEMLVFSANGSFKADYGFGFVFQNSRFENADMNEKMNDKKLYGSSVNKNNYAYDLKVAIEAYETRLKNVAVTMNFSAPKKEVSLEITGSYEEDFREQYYKKEITFYIWN
jgi:hypothetical protein